MARYRTDMNSIYISPRAQEALDPIAQCPLTTVVAPMGYGKTTAVQWFLDRRREAGDQVVRVSIYSNDLPLFWRSFQAAWRGTPLAGQLDPMAFPVGDTALGLLSERLLDLLDGAGDYYLFLDDYHLMKDDQVTALLLALARLPGAPLHLIVASRDQVLSPSQALRLGRDLHQITAGDLALSQEEVSAYSRRCGVALPPADLAHLAQTSEGWFSAVYLNLKAYQAHGTLLTSGHDIYEMLNEAMLDPLPQERVDFLARMSLADEFTAEQAAFVTGLAESRELMRALTESNAFLRRLPDGQNYRLHHMMKECLGRRFREESPEEQRLVRCRHGAWYERQGEYLRAFHFYLQAGDDASVLRLIDVDTGLQMAGLAPQKLLSWLAQCREEALLTAPRSLLVLMRRLFSLGAIPQMLTLKDLLPRALEQSDLPEREKQNLQGECDLILSFLGYNDIAAMSVRHQSACRQMDRPAISIHKNGAWTFGSPSVLMMFHRTPGEMGQELETMLRSMPYYYQVTDGHGMGAERVMEAEVAYGQGRFVDAVIALAQARSAAAAEGQRYMLLCCDFLSLRLALTGATEFEGDWYHKRRAEWIPALDPVLLMALDGCRAYLQALLGLPEELPGWLAGDSLEGANLLRPARPMFEVILNQVLLARGEYAKVLGRLPQCLAQCSTYPYALGTLHLLLQQAGAYDALGKGNEAYEALRQAAELAAPDRFWMPFVENTPHLKNLVPHLPAQWRGEIQRLTEPYEATCASLLRHHRRPAPLAGLSETEYQICLAIAERRSNREIGQALFLSEGTVKQYVNQIYTKLHLTGAARDKRRLLGELVSRKN